jgi:uncharacterized protein (DUF2164 family)
MSELIGSGWDSTGRVIMGMGLNVGAFSKIRKLGKFSGTPSIDWLGPLDYKFHGGRGFSFTRSNGQVITPGDMSTDGGSIPRVAWSLPGFSPWDFFPAYLIHDWLFEVHHLGKDESTFEEANLAMAEAIWTLKQNGVVQVTDLQIWTILTVVSSPLGRNVWNHGLRASEMAIDEVSQER